MCGDERLAAKRSRWMPAVRCHELNGAQRNVSLRTKIWTQISKIAVVVHLLFLQERLTALRQDSDWFPNGSARAVADCLHKRVWRERERDLFTHSILLFQSQNLFLYSSGNFHAAFPWRSEREWTARDPGYRFGIRSPLNALGIGFPFDYRVSDAKNAQ